MKLLFKKTFIIFSLIIILFLSLGVISASNDSFNGNGLSSINDINYAINNDNNYYNSYVNSYVNDYDNNSNLINNDFNSLNDSSSELNNNFYTNSSFNEFGINKNYTKDISIEKIKSDNVKQSFKDIQYLIDNSIENDTIELNGVYIGFENDKIVLNKTLSINGINATLDGNNLTEILLINANNVKLNNIKFINANLTGLTILANNTLIENCVFENCSNGELGSALVIYGNYNKILNSNFTNNIANKSSCHHTDGAAIYMYGNYGTVENCNFYNNSGYNYETASSGGAINWKGDYGFIKNSSFINNGAYSKFGWTLHGEEETYLADGLGGAIYWLGNFGTITDCLFDSNLAHAKGGAIYFKSVSGFTLNNSNFTNNSAIGEGGVFYFAQNIFNFTISSCNFINNTAQGLDGIVYNFSNNGSILYSGRFSENLTVNNSSFINNSGNSDFYYLGSNLNISNSIFEHNVPLGSNNSNSNSLDSNNLGLNSLDSNNLTLNYLYSNNLGLNSLDSNNLNSNSSIVYNNSSVITFLNGTLNNNFWGKNINSTDEFIHSALIYSRGEYISPDSWINLNLSGLDFINEKGIYNYSLTFISNNDSLLENTLPVYKPKIENNVLENNIFTNETIKNNSLKFTYDCKKSAKDLISVYNNLGNLILSKDVLNGIITVNDSGNDTKDIQDAINNAVAGDIIILSNKTYVLDTILINKDITISSFGNTRITLSNESNLLFNIPYEDNLTKVIISDISFDLKNEDTVALVYAVNDSNPFLVDVVSVDIYSNEFRCKNDAVVSQSITILELNSSRPILALNREINIKNNSIDSGINVFNFAINSIVNGYDVFISNENIFKKDISKIICEDMETFAIDTKVDGRVGKYFNVKLTDLNGNPLINKFIQIGFNGNVYNRTTNAIGDARLQINLKNKGIYTFAVCFLGDDFYNSSFVVAKIKVNLQKPLLSSSNKSYKSSAKTKTLTAILKTVNGNPIVGKPISFSLNGKTYSGKTNSNGLVTVKVSLSTKKTYSFSVKFVGDNTYSAVSKSGKIVIS